jgi:predicted nucleotidyltransferase
MATATTTESVVSKDAARKPRPAALEEIVRRIVAAADPEQIIMFGSAARGEMRPDSDIDLLVIKANVHRLATTHAIRRALRGVDYAVDLVVATPEDVERYRHTWHLVFEPALREGQQVYAKRALPVA